MTKSEKMAIAAGSGFLTVVLGAFGSHLLNRHLLELGTRSLWETAVFYQLTHTIVLLWMSGKAPERSFAFLCFLIGIGLFCGSLYIMALTGWKMLGAVTPLGGIALLLGWARLFIQALQEGRRP